jgi:2,4-dienoyl-CoA reductase-like NADH-dependent reductase (Old Yellow Enzyme family)
MFEMKETPMSQLFQPMQLGSLELDNRIIVAPMCQYSAVDGAVNDWHLIHLGGLALSGAGLLIMEATAVSPESRISPGDLGLYNDETELALSRLRESLGRYSPIPITMQINHAGRKASSQAPWDGGKQIRPDQESGWQALAPSAVPISPAELPPTALDKAGFAKIRADFKQAAIRAARAGIDGLELHAAHGYLLHEFLSPLSNTRADEYGGSLHNRMRFPMELFSILRENFPAEKPVWIRISATDWVEGGWTPDESIVFSKEVKKLGAAAIHVSSGGVSSLQKIPIGPGYQVPLARRIKEEVGLTTIAVGLITDAKQAEAIIANGDADAVALARALLYNPHWPWHAAAELGADVIAPKPYWRSAPMGGPNPLRGTNFGQR